MSHLGVVVNKESEVLIDEAIGGELFSDRVRDMVPQNMAS